LLGSGYDEKSYSERKISRMIEKLMQEDSAITRKIIYELTRDGPDGKGQSRDSEREDLEEHLID
jgi:hypothetical protein